MHTWRHATRVVGAEADFSGLRRSFAVSASEGFAYKARVLRGARTVGSASGLGRAGVDTLVRLPKLRRGAYRLQVELSSETNPDRVSTFAKKFRVR
jgi:hypothetical protein